VFFFQAEDGIRDFHVTGVQTCALPIFMLFGLNRVGRGLHMFATVMVAFGTAFSAFWILSVNSWMHTPAGYAINEAGQFIPEDWRSEERRVGKECRTGGSGRH